MRSTGLGKAILGLNFSDTLREAYRKDNILPKLIEHEKLPIHYVNKHYVSLEVLTDVDQSTELRQDANAFIEPQGIFDRVDSAGKSWILLLGDAGTGKTTLMHYLAHMWGNNSLKSQRIQYVFRVRLRSLLAESWKDWLQARLSHKLSEHSYYKFARFLEYCLITDQNLPAKNLFDIIMTRLTQKHENKFLFLLDGYDEVFHLDTVDSGSELHSFIKIIKTFSNVILTSRPNAISKELSSAFNIKLRNVGFTEDYMKEYIGKYFREDQHAVQFLWKFLEVNQPTKKLCYTPINLTLVCLIWSDEASQNKIRFADGKLSVLYREIILWMCKRYINKVEVMSVDLIDLTPESLLIHPVVNFLKKLAFDAINKAQESIESASINQLLLTFEETITNRFKHRSIRNLQAIRAVNKFGLLKVEDTQKDLTRVPHEFIHKSFKEWLCASYLKGKLLGSSVFKEESAFDVVDYIAKKGGDASHFMVMKFLSGLIIETENHEAIVKFWEAIWSSQISNEELLVVPGARSVELLMQLLSQAVLNGVVHPSVPKHIIEFVDFNLWHNLSSWERKLAESRYMSAEIVGKLLKQLESSEEYYYITALNSLAQLNIPSALRASMIELIFSKTKSHDENVVEASVSALYAMIHEEKVMDLMYRILEEGGERAVIIAMELLSQVGGKEIANSIVRKLDSGNVNIVISAVISIGELGSNKSVFIDAGAADIAVKLEKVLYLYPSNELVCMAVINSFIKLETIHQVVERYLDSYLVGGESRFKLVILDSGVLVTKSVLKAIFEELDSINFKHFLSPFERGKIIKIIKEIVKINISLSVRQTFSLFSALLNVLQDTYGCIDNFIALASNYIKIDQLYTEAAVDFLIGAIKSECLSLSIHAARVINFIYKRLNKLSDKLIKKLIQALFEWLKWDLNQIEKTKSFEPLFYGRTEGFQLENLEIKCAILYLFSLLTETNARLGSLCSGIIHKFIAQAIEDLVKLLLDVDRAVIGTVGGVSGGNLRENYIKYVGHMLFTLPNKQRKRVCFAIGLWINKVPMQITEYLIKLFGSGSSEELLETILILGSIYNEIPKSDIPSIIQKLLQLLQNDDATVKQEAAHLIAVLKSKCEVAPPTGSHIEVELIDWSETIKQLSEYLKLESNGMVKKVLLDVLGAFKGAVVAPEEYYYLKKLYTQNDFLRECAFLNLASSDILSNEGNVAAVVINSSSFLINNENRNELLTLIERKKNGESMTSISKPLKMLSARLRNPNTGVIQKDLSGMRLLIVQNNQINNEILSRFARWIRKEALDCKITLSSIEVGGYDLSQSSGYSAATEALRIQLAQRLYERLKIVKLTARLPLLADAAHSRKAFSLLDATMPLGPHSWRVSVLNLLGQVVIVILEQSLLSHVVVKKLFLEGSVRVKRTFTAPLVKVTKAFRSEIFGRLDDTTLGLTYKLSALTLSNGEVPAFMKLSQDLLRSDEILRSIHDLPSKTEGYNQRHYSEVSYLKHRELLGMAYEDGSGTNWLAERMTNVEGRVTAIDCKVTDTAGEVESLKATMLNKASQLDRLLEDHQGSINVLEALVRGQSEIINFLGLDLNAVHENMQELATELDNVRHTTESIRVQGVDLAFTTVNSHYQEVEALKDKMEKQQSAIERLTTILDTHTVDIVRVNELLEENTHDAEFKKSIAGKIYQETLYHNLVKQLHNVGLASSMVQTGIFASAQTGKIGKVGQLFSMFSSSIPLIGLGAKICGTILKAVDSHWQKKMLERFSNLGTITEMNQLFKLTAQSLMQEPTELDQDLLNKTKSLGDKIYGILSAASEAIMDVAELPLMVIDSAVNEFENLHEAVEQETEQGEKHAALIVSVITAHVYRGDAECVANATSSTEEKREVLRGFVLRSYGMIRGSAENFAREILVRVKAKLSVQVAFSIKEKHLKREEKFVVVFSDRLLKTGCESLIKETETREQTLNHLVEKLSQIDRCRIFKTTASEKKLAVHEDIDREVNGFKTANYLRFAGQIERLIEGAGSSI